MEKITPHVYTEEDGRELVRLLNMMTQSPLPLLCIRYWTEYGEQDASGKWKRTKLEWRCVDPGERKTAEEEDAYATPHATLMDALGLGAAERLNRPALPTWPYSPVR